ncbi:MAG: NADPH-dependent 2,4-dienoyl-CoA reductase, partial [Micrococcales bacterium]|nr:NADPH-dependent 2,4-dienoyl-CoA reductase [Micrococcales bacterium]
VGVDVCEFLTTGHSPALDADAWRHEWGVGDPARTRGGVEPPAPEASPREVVLLQRKSTPIGRGLGKTTGWVHRASLRAKGVEQVTGVAEYERIDDDGLHVRLGDGGTERRTIACDTVVVCAGQDSVRTVADELADRGLRVHVVGGADVAAELDAKRAIRQGTEVAARL